MRREICFYKYKHEYGENIALWSPNIDHLPSIDISEIEKILNSDPHYGFAQTCQMFFTNQTCFRMGSAFFTNAHFRLCQDINNLLLSEDAADNTQYLVLTIVLFRKEVNLEQACVFADDMSIALPDRLRLEQTKKLLMHRNLIQSSESKKNFYEMGHNSILEAVLISVGQYWPEYVIVLMPTRKCSTNLSALQDTKKDPNENLLLPFPKNVQLL